MNPKNQAEMLLRGRLGVLARAREDLVGLGNGVLEQGDEISRDMYATDQEKKLRVEKVRAEAQRELRERLAAERTARAELKETTYQLLDRHRPSQQSEQTYRHLQAQGAAPGDIVDRAVELNDVELAVAARAALKMIPKPTRGAGGEAWLEREELTHATDLALAKVLPGSERDVLPEALIVSRNSHVDELAERFAVKAILGTDHVQERMKLAYAENDVARELAGEGGEV